MSPDQIAAWVARTRAEQGLPRYVEDAAALDKLVRMLGETLDDLEPAKQKSRP